MAKDNLFVKSSFSVWHCHNVVTIIVGGTWFKWLQRTFIYLSLWKSKLQKICGGAGGGGGVGRSAVIKCHWVYILQILSPPIGSFRMVRLWEDVYFVREKKNCRWGGGSCWWWGIVWKEVSKSRWRFLPSGKEIIGDHTRFVFASDFKCVCRSLKFFMRKFGTGGWGNVSPAMLPYFS